MEQLSRERIVAFIVKYQSILVMLFLGFFSVTSVISVANMLFNYFQHDPFVLLPAYLHSKVSQAGSTRVCRDA